MATFKEITANDVKTARSYLTQLVDVIQEDISGSSTRRKYQVFVTGGIGPGVTSSLYQTVYDQDFTLQTANAIVDVTFGIHPTSSIVQNASTGEDTAGKVLYPSSSLMMREKTDIYRQFAQTLLGDATSKFTSPFTSTNDSDGIDVALFMSFKRLFARDAIKRESFAMRFFQSASLTNFVWDDPLVWTNVNRTSELGTTIFTDVGSATNKLITHGGTISHIVDSSNTNRTVGLLFNDAGIVVLDLAKITSASQKMIGIIDAVATGVSGTGGTAGKSLMGSSRSENPDAKMIPDFVVSASIDNVLDHICATRFSSGTFTAIAFQNITNINSTLVFCRATADEFNYSSNPTYVDTANRIVVIDEGQEDTQRSFTFVTGIGLYDSNDNLLAVAKLSRPIEKNDEKDLTFRVRLDFAKKRSTRFTK